MCIVVQEELGHAFIREKRGMILATSSRVVECNVPDVLNAPIIGDGEMACDFVKSRKASCTPWSAREQRMDKHLETSTNDSKDLRKYVQQQLAKLR